jgi:hypothetical protein
MTSGWKHGINLGCAIVGYCIGWYRREDPFVRNLERYLDELRRSA